ncbi:MAG: P-loop NTPase [Pirellulales bacterium]|nr:P-loop NTPase [Pirellulales bacterium]
MNDQAELLRKLVDHASDARAQVATPSGVARPRVVAVAAGKGGVGTSTVAVNLAITLAQSGQRAVLADCDLFGGDAAQLCQLQPVYSIADVLAGRRTVHEVLLRGPAGIQVLPGVWALGEPCDATPAALHRLLLQFEALGAHADFIVLDVGAAMTRPARRLWQAADRVLLTTTPDPVAVMDAYAAIKVLMAGHALSSIRLLVNQATDPLMAADVHERLSRACRRFLGEPVALAGHLPAINRGAALFTRDDASGVAAMALDRITQELAEALLAQRDAAASGSLLDFTAAA